MGRKKGGRNAPKTNPPVPSTSSPSEVAAGSVPPGLAQDADALLAEAKAIGTPGAEGEKVKRKYTKRTDEIPFPKEALAVVHKGVWTFIAKSLRSDFTLTPQGADEMAIWADLCLRQYLSPYLAEHAALAGYVLTQCAAFGMVIALRRPKEKATEAPAP